jgi:hypothetical protein
MTDAARRAEADAIGQDIAAVAARATLSEAYILARVRDVDARNLWRDAAAKSCAHWLAWWLKLDLDTARDRVRVARKLGDLPPVMERLESGRLSYSQARAIARVACPDDVGQLLELAETKTAIELEQICRRYGRHLAAEAPPKPSDRYLRSKRLDNGLARIDAALFPDEAQRVMAAIESILRATSCPPPAAPAEADPSAEVCPQPTLGEKRADALVAMADQVLAEPGALSRSVRQELTVIVDQATLKGREPAEGATRCELADGAPVAPETIDRVACSATTRHIVVDAKGTPLDVGRRTRRISEKMMAALVERDGHCTFPGCTSRAYLDGHHIRHWTRGGATTLSNLSLQCGFHHRCLHEGGYRCVVEDGELVYYSPEGKRLPRSPAPRCADLDAIAASVSADACAG